MRPLTVRALLLAALAGPLQAGQIDAPAPGELTPGTRLGEVGSSFGAPVPLQLTVPALTGASALSPASVLAPAPGLVQPTIVPSLAAESAPVPALPNSALTPDKPRAISEHLKPAAPAASPEAGVAAGRVLFDQSGVRVEVAPSVPAAPSGAVSASPRVIVRRGASRSAGWEVDGRPATRLSGDVFKDVLIHPFDTRLVIKLFSTTGAGSLAEKRLEMSSLQPLLEIGRAPRVVDQGALEFVTASGNKRAGYIVQERVFGREVGELLRDPDPAVRRQALEETRRLFEDLIGARVRMADRVALGRSIMIGRSGQGTAERAWVVDAGGSARASAPTMVDKLLGRPDPLRVNYEQVLADLGRVRPSSGKLSPLRRMQASLEARGKGEVFQEVEAILYTDGLTGLPNRAFVMEKAQALLRDVKEPTVALLDMNNFGPVNAGLAEVHGPVAGKEMGDGMLADAGPKIAAIAREAGVHAARLGGEEIVAFGSMRDVIDFAAAMRKVFPPEKILRDAKVVPGGRERTAIDAAMVRLQRTGPIGDFTYGLARAQGRSFAAALKAADGALNRAKAAGLRGEAVLEDPGHLTVTRLPDSAARAERVARFADLPPPAPRPQRFKEVLDLKAKLTEEESAAFLEAAYTDPLTLTKTAEWIDLARPQWEADYEGRGSAAMISARNLKAINDVLGHGAGDRYLKKLGEIMSGEAKRLRGLGYSVEEPVHVGGKEFLIVGKDAAEAARLVKEKFAAQLEAGLVLESERLARLRQEAAVRGLIPRDRAHNLGTLRAVDEPFSGGFRKTYERLIFKLESAKIREDRAGQTREGVGSAAPQAALSLVDSIARFERRASSGLVRRINLEKALAVADAQKDPDQRLHHALAAADLLGVRLDQILIRRQGQLGALEAETGLSGEARMARRASIEEEVQNSLLAAMSKAQEHLAKADAVFRSRVPDLPQAESQTIISDLLEQGLTSMEIEKLLIKAAAPKSMRNRPDLLRAEIARQLDESGLVVAQQTRSGPVVRDAQSVRYLSELLKHAPRDAVGAAQNDAYIERHIGRDTLELLAVNPQIRIRIYAMDEAAAVRDLHEAGFTRVVRNQGNKLTDFAKFTALNPKTGEMAFVVVGPSGRAYPREIAAHFLYHGLGRMGTRLIEPSRIEIYAHPNPNIVPREEFMRVLKAENLDPDVVVIGNVEQLQRLLGGSHEGLGPPLKPSKTVRTPVLFGQVYEINGRQVLSVKIEPHLYADRAGEFIRALNELSTKKRGVVFTGTAGAMEAGVSINDIAAPGVFSRADGLVSRALLSGENLAIDFIRRNHPGASGVHADRGLEVRNVDSILFEGPEWLKAHPNGLVEQESAGVAEAAREGGADFYAFFRISDKPGTEAHFNENEVNRPQSRAPVYQGDLLIGILRERLSSGPRPAAK